jgi:iron(III) transport system ATP-binding protein
MPVAIGIRDLSKTFGTGAAAAKAVDDVSLDIAPGELFFLLGPSGCGKTTLLRMIAGFIEPTAGRILFDGRDVSPLPPNKRNTGMVFQSYALWPHMTVAANVAFGLGVRKVGAAERQRRAREALAAVRMEAYAARKPNQLSGGQQQRVALARALVIRPDVLLLDEPLSNLDAKLRAELRSEIRSICKSSSITTVYVTHDQKEALSMADRLAIMDQGRIAQVGSPDDLYRSPRTRFVAAFLGEANFLDGVVAGTEREFTVVETPAGRLLSRSSGKPGAWVTVSIRPEAIRLEPDSPIRAQVQDASYFGDVVQYTVRVRQATNLLVSQFNPSRAPLNGQTVSLAIAPEDVILLEA